jgi:hypothetical protein
VNERDLPRTHVGSHTRRKQAPRAQLDVTKLATATTFAVRTAKATEEQAQAVARVLTARTETALTVARRIVAILEGGK